MKLGTKYFSSADMTAEPVKIFRSAEFSADRSRRYLLMRSWYGLSLPKLVNLIGLNPSDANETRDDMTIRKGCGFARRWGYNGIIMTNLSAVVSTDPWGLPLWSGIDFHQNLAAWARAIGAADIVVAAWGAIPRGIARKIEVPELVYKIRKLCQPRAIYCIGETQNGSPMHPSRCAYTNSPVLWRECL